MYRYGTHYDTRVFFVYVGLHKLPGSGAFHKSFHKIKRRRLMMKKNKTGNLKGFRQFLLEEEGMGTVEIILIIVVLIALVIIFKTQLTDLVNKVFEKITESSNTVMS
jgi:Flp pilus assembly pilin Flp